MLNPGAERVLCDPLSPLEHTNGRRAGQCSVTMDCTPPASLPRREACTPQIITSSSIMEVNQMSGTMDPQTEPLLEKSTEPDMLDFNSHIWITEESRFTYKNMVQRVDLQNAMYLSYFVTRSNRIASLSIIPSSGFNCKYSFFRKKF